MLVDLQPPASNPKLLQHQLRRLEGPVAVAERRPDAVIAEADDVRPAVAADVGEETGVLVDPASRRPW